MLHEPERDGRVTVGVEGDGECCRVVSDKMVEQLQKSFMWEPQRAAPLGAPRHTALVCCRETLKAKLETTAPETNRFD